ncbi:MAG: histidinol dehydrogenase [Acidobacteria bacterium]|nr:histidinol dehydrogenase [Acidobacteriota bacterium]
MSEQPVVRILDAKSASRLLKRRAARMEEAETTVRPILEAVRKRGDAAVLEYARQFDKFEGKSLRVKPTMDGVSKEFRDAVAVASKNIRAFAKLQLPRPTSKLIAPGLRVGQVIRPIPAMAAYVPAGRYPLPSTVLMTVIPAQVAGVPSISITAPKPVPEILAAAAILGVENVFQIGGAHAIAAFAYGTKSVPRVDRIVGPGNIYVAAAKKLLAGEVGIDFVAGPTEILIIAAEGHPKWIAADMLAQAEHDTDASAILLTTSKRLAAAVEAELAWQLEYLPTAPTARVALKKNSAILIVESLEQAVELSNQFAPEHLSLHHPELLPGIINAGGVFLGAMSPEAAGDYAAGPSHVLPTSGAARLRGGLSSADFVKMIATQELSEKALEKLAPAITTLARAEGLEAHARSVEVRREP